MQDASFSLRVTAMGAKKSELAPLAETITSEIDHITSVVRCIHIEFIQQET